MLAGRPASRHAGTQASKLDGCPSEQPAFTLPALPTAAPLSIRPTCEEARQGEHRRVKVHDAQAWGVEVNRDEALCHLLLQEEREGRRGWVADETQPDAAGKAGWLAVQLAKRTLRRAHQTPSHSQPSQQSSPIRQRRVTASQVKQSTRPTACLKGGPVVERPVRGGEAARCQLLSRDGPYAALLLQLGPCSCCALAGPPCKVGLCRGRGEEAIRVPGHPFRAGCRHCSCGGGGGGIIQRGTGRRCCPLPCSPGRSVGRESWVCTSRVMAHVKASRQGAPGRRQSSGSGRAAVAVAVAEAVPVGSRGP